MKRQPKIKVEQITPMTFNLLLKSSEMRLFKHFSSAYWVLNENNMPMLVFLFINAIFCQVYQNYTLFLHSSSKHNLTKTTHFLNMYSLIHKIVAKVNQKTFKDTLKWK